MEEVKTPLDRRFCERLRAIRLERELTHAQVADLIGIARPHYTVLEAGKNSPSLATVYKIAQALEVDAIDLLAATVDAA